MAAFDFDAAMRWARFAQRRTLARRKDADLPFIGSAEVAGELLFDTCFYIDAIQGRAPIALRQVADRRPVNHSTIAVQELMHLVGALRPDHAGTAEITAQIRAVIKGMVAHRILMPDADVVGRAALLAGILSRVQGYAADARQRALNDCTLFLQAQKHGLTILTANVADFDILLQMIPAGRVSFYRRSDASPTSSGS